MDISTPPTPTILPPIRLLFVHIFLKSFFRKCCWRCPDKVISFKTYINCNYCTVGFWRSPCKKRTEIRHDSSIKDDKFNKIEQITWYKTVVPIETTENKRFIIKCKSRDLLTKGHFLLYSTVCWYEELLFPCTCSSPPWKVSCTKNIYT